MMLCALMALSVSSVFAAANVAIADVDKGVEFVDIRNTGDETAWMNGWELVSQNGNQRCFLAGSIPAGQTMRVYAQEGWVPDRVIHNCNFDGLIWNNGKLDVAILCNTQGVEVSRFPANQNATDPMWADVGCPNDATAAPPAQGDPCPPVGAWPPGCVPGGSAPAPAPADPPPSTGGSDQPCPDSGAWPPGCVPNGGGGSAPLPAGGGGNACPASGAWPPGCVPGGTAPPADSPPPSSGAGESCPPAGKWPPGCTP